MTTASKSIDTESSGLIRVWDPLVRCGHWLLVGGFFIAYFTEEDLLTQHVWAGYVAGAVVVVRVIWGFIGTRHARFSDFLYVPAKIVSYFGGLFSGRAERYIGHSPAGGAMVLALLIGVAATVYTGLVIYAIEDNAGPLATVVTAESERPQSGLLIAGALADEEDEEGHEDGSREDYWEESHEFFANLTLVLIALHVGGVLLASYVHKENLIKSMFTGVKRRE